MKGLSESSSRTDLRTSKAQVMHVLSYRYMDTDTLNTTPEVMPQIHGTAKVLTHILQPHLPLRLS